MREFNFANLNINYINNYSNETNYNELEVINKGIRYSNENIRKISMQKSVLLECSKLHEMLIKLYGLILRYT